MKETKLIRSREKKKKIEIKIKIKKKHCVVMQAVACFCSMVRCLFH